jgi:hypothetical protein
VEHQVSDDIHKFIKDKIGRLAKRREYPPQLQSFVEKRFHELAKGTFLWIGIAAKELKRLEPGEVKASLEPFQPSLNILYERILLQIPVGKRLNAIQILRWITVAKRPLTTLEIGTIKNIQPDESLGLTCDMLVAEQANTCGQLLVLSRTETGRKAELIHQSAKDSLSSEDLRHHPTLSSFHVEYVVANSYIADYCLNHLSDCFLRTEGMGLRPEQHLGASEQNIGKYPFMSYASPIGLNMFWTVAPSYVMRKR